MQRVRRWVAEVAATTRPEEVVWCDGSEAEYGRLIDRMLSEGTMIELNGAGQTYLRAAGSLGWAFPASLGAKCAAGDRKVICFTGDGGFYYHLAELESARRCHIPVVIIVNNNSGFGQNLTGVHRIAGDRLDRGEALIRFGPTDFTAVARSFGVRGIRVEQPGAIAAALQQAITANGPVVVDVVTALEPRAPAASSRW